MPQRSSAMKSSVKYEFHGAFVLLWVKLLFYDADCKEKSNSKENSYAFHVLK